MKKLLVFILAMVLTVVPALAEEAAEAAAAIDLTDIITAVLALIAALITRYVIPWIKEKTTLEQQKRIQAAIDTVVFAAEKLYGAGQGEKKKQYVLAKLRANGYDVDDQMVRAGIEAAVMALDLKVNSGVTLEVEDLIDVIQN